MPTPKKLRGSQSRIKKATSNASRKSSLRRTIVPSRQMVEAKPVPASNPVSRQTVAETAYFLWLKRGGDATSNWIEAERLLAAGAQR